MGNAVEVWVGRGDGGGVELGAAMVGGTAVADGNVVGATLGVGGCGGLLQAASKPIIKTIPARNRVRRLGISINIPFD